MDCTDKWGSDPTLFLFLLYFPFLSHELYLDDACVCVCLKDQVEVKLWMGYHELHLVCTDKNAIVCAILLQGLKKSKYHKTQVTFESLKEFLQLAYC